VVYTSLIHFVDLRSIAPVRCGLPHLFWHAVEAGGYNTHLPAASQGAGSATCSPSPRVCAGRGRGEGSALAPVALAEISDTEMLALAWPGHERVAFLAAVGASGDSSNSAIMSRRSWISRLRWARSLALQDCLSARRWASLYFRPVISVL
jgi:hypothetical protein